MADSLTLRFWAAVQSLATDGKRLATFYLMNTSPNRNGWAVTGKALEEALPTLLGKPLGCIPGYRVDHVHEPIQVGRWIKAEKPDGYALATAELTDDTAWEKLKTGEWGPISVVIKAFRVTCSKCGVDITGAPDEHVLGGAAYEVVESFVFDRVDFVSDPAYPQAGILTLSELILGASRFKKGQAGASEDYPKPVEETRLDEIEETRKEAESLKAENSSLRAENTGLKAELQQVKDLQHAEKALHALQARAKAGLVKDRKQEEERLDKLNDAALELLVEDAEQLIERTPKSAGPKARFNIEVNDLDAAVEETRLRLFGHRREAQ